MHGESCKEMFIGAVSPFDWNSSWVKNAFKLPYLPLYKVHPSIIHTPILDCILNKKKCKQKTGKVVTQKQPKKFMCTLEKRQLDNLFRNVTPCTSDLQND